MTVPRSLCENETVLGEAMTIEICGRDAAIERVANARERTEIISITSMDEADVAFPPSACVASILRLKFNDLTEAFDDEGMPYGRPLPQQRDFDGLRAFVDALDGERLIVHCWEGASRSAAVAAAVHAYRGGADALMTHARFAPNPRVYALACRELGVTPVCPDFIAIADGDAWRLERG